MDSEHKSAANLESSINAGDPVVEDSPFAIKTSVLSGQALNEDGKVRNILLHDIFSTLN